MPQKADYLYSFIHQQSPVLSFRRTSGTSNRPWLSLACPVGSKFYQVFLDISDTLPTLLNYPIHRTASNQLCFSFFTPG
jgi:hypothetical protein